MSNAIELKSISKAYKDKIVLDDINLNIKNGHIYGLLGQNGAGKTSTLRIIIGITEADKGKVFVNGKESKGIVEAYNFGYMPEEKGLYKRMKVEDQLLFFAQLKGLKYSKAKAEINLWAEKLNFTQWKSKKIEELSKGMAQKIQFVATILHNPDIIILDEPFSGLDPLNADIIKSEIFNLSQQGKTIIFSTHRMEQVEEICTDISLLHNGKIILNGNIKDIKEKYFLSEYKLLTDNPEQIENNNIYEVVSKTNNDVIIRLKDGSSLEDIFGYFSNYNIAKVYSISKNVPSLHKIFIENVQ